MELGIKERQLLAVDTHQCYWNHLVQENTEKVKAEVNNRRQEQDERCDEHECAAAASAGDDCKLPCQPAGSQPHTRSVLSNYFIIFSASTFGGPKIVYC